MKLLIGTSNEGKFIEVSESLKDLSLELLMPEQVGITKAPHEEGATYRENAAQKARFYFEKALVSTLADDSGIVVDALRKELGIHTRRWGAGPEASDQQWIEFFLQRMRAENNKQARFICNLCYIDNDKNEHYFEGMCDGVITESLEAKYLPGLPISACFKPNGLDRVYSALSVEEKNAISHRGIALMSFKKFLQENNPTI